MSQNLENQFKEALQNMEAPYNPKAWESLQARLDVAMPVASPKKAFQFWKVSAIVIGTVGVTAALYFLNKDNHSLAKENSIVETKIKEKNNEPFVPISDVKVENQSVAKNGDLNSEFGEDVVLKTADSRKISTDKKVVNSKISKSENVNTVQNTNSIKELNELTNTIVGNSFISTKQSSNGNSTPFQLPMVGKQCVNEELKIVNENSSNLVIIYPSGKKLTIGSKKQSLLKISEVGTYTLTDGYFSSSTFVAQASQESDFEIDFDNIYKNGVPSTLVKASTNATNYSWNANGRNKTSKECEFHFFKKGDYTIQLQTTDQNGCKSSTSKNVAVQKDYNLMAVDAFNPNHSDNRKNKFMPFALTERNTGFTLTIIDPKDAGVVYQTSDASAGWDGIDVRTDKMATNGSNYVWKVNLTNPIQGENENYKGVVFIAM